MAEIPDSWRPYRSRQTGEPVTLTWEQIAAVEHAFWVWSQVVDKEQADRSPEKRQTNMSNSANWQKSCLLGRILTTGRPPLPDPPPRYESAPWYDLIENGRSDLHGGHFEQVFGPYDRDGQTVMNIAGDIGWTVVRDADPEGWILAYPRNGEWLLRHRSGGDPPTEKGTSIASGTAVTTWTTEQDWVLERVEVNGQ